MKLSRNIQGILNSNQALVFDQTDLKLPDRILQFEDGRMVVVKSGSDYDPQIIKSRKNFINKISSEKNQWLEILTCASNSDLEIIIFRHADLEKNVLEDNIKFNPPFSFPGKLLAFLFRRFRYFKAAPDKGLVILSVGVTSRKTEMLEAIILELAHLNNLEPAFLDWIENANYFCNKKMLGGRVSFRKQ